MKETWRQLEPGTAQLIVGDARITITCAAGGPSPEAWWAGERLADRLAVLERLAGRRLDGAAREERNAFARQVLDDGSPAGGSLLRRFVRHCQQAPPATWPADIRLAVLQAIAARVTPAVATVRRVG